MANAGNYAVGIGTGAASGAGMGAFLGPVGALIGGGLGGLAGGLSTLLSSSDEAKQRKKALEQYEAQRAAALHQYTEQQRNQNYDAWEDRNAARVGALFGTNLKADPMYAATHHKTFSEDQARTEFDDRAGAPPTFPDDPPVNYGALVSSLGSLGSTLGGLSRAGSAQDQLDALIQSRKNGAAQSVGSPWGGYSSDYGSGNPFDKWSMY